MPDFVCPRCGSGHLRRSHTRGASEKFKKLLGWCAFRCRAKPCGWRGLIKTKSLSQAIGKELKEREKQIFKFLLVVAIIGVGIYLDSSFINYEPPPPPE